MKRLILAVLAVALLACSAAYAQNLTATEIIEKADQKQRGETSMGELKMTILPVGRLKTGDASVRVGGCLNGVLKVGTAPGRFSENPPGFE